MDDFITPANPFSPPESHADSSEEDPETEPDRNKTPSPPLEPCSDSSEEEAPEKERVEDQYLLDLFEAEELEGIVKECDALVTQYSAETKTIDRRNPSRALELISKVRLVLRRWEALVRPWAGTEWNERFEQNKNHY